MVFACLFHSIADKVKEYKRLKLSLHIGNTDTRRERDFVARVIRDPADPVGKVREVHNCRHRFHGNHFSYLLIHDLNLAHERAGGSSIRHCGGSTGAGSCAGNKSVTIIS